MGLSKDLEEVTGHPAGFGEVVLERPERTVCGHIAALDAEEGGDCQGLE
ncbi:MAG: hypothetical protein K6T59_16925 [Bryobacteraceae bacterium]|nr:hypothetical protein [Bryobacteraceae bacterium]